MCVCILQNVNFVYSGIAASRTMSVKWKDWCRLCACSDGTATVVFNNKDILLADKIFKYLSILIENHDDLPQSVCESCVQKIGCFDRYADQCLRVQSMFKTIVVEANCADDKAGLIRREILSQYESRVPSHTEAESTENSAMENNHQDPAANDNTIAKKPKAKISRKRNGSQKPSPLNARSRRNSKHAKDNGDSECERRVSGRLKGIVQVQKTSDFGSDTDVKEEEEKHGNTRQKDAVPKKRSRSGKTLVGAAKRKAKMPCVVKSNSPKVVPGIERTTHPDAEQISELLKEEPAEFPSKIIHPSDKLLAFSPEEEENLINDEGSLDDKPNTSFDSFEDFEDEDNSDDDKDDKTEKLMDLHTPLFRCDKCDKAFHRKSLYDLHVRSHLPKEEQPYVCCKCARRFHSEALLRHHERVHLPREERLIYPCSVCNKKFSSRSNVSAHLKAVHFGERPFVCDQCGHSFTSKGILQEHLTTHSDETPFHCTLCTKSFKTKYRLKIHMDTHRETPYQCPMCPHQLSTRRTLRMHLLVHKDVKAYQCATCGKAFKRSKDLKNHHNLHTGRRPYICIFCPRAFAHGSNCRAHKRKMHPEELRIYEESLAAAAAATENGESGTIEATTQTPSGSASTVEVEIKVLDPSERHMVETESLPDLTTNPTLQNSPSTTPLSNSMIVTVPSSEYGRTVVFDAESIATSSLKQSGVNNVPRIITHHGVIPTSSADYTASSVGMNNIGHVTVGPLVNHSDNSGHTVTPMIALSAAPIVRVNDSCRNPNLIPRNEHMSAVEESSAERNLSTVNLNHDRRSVTTVNIIDSNGLATITPLNLNVSEVHTNRPHHVSESPTITVVEDSSYMSGTRRPIENFTNSRHHLQTLNTNIQIHHPNQHHNMAAVGRTLPEPPPLTRIQDRSIPEPPPLTRIQHNQHSSAVSLETLTPLQVQGYSTLNHLYHHGDTIPPAVAAAIAHSGTVAVPAFPGNPYVHHNIAYARTGNM